MYFAPTFLLLCLTTPCFGMKLSMEGNLNLGKEILDTLAEYLGFTFRGSRRSLLPTDEDPISSIVRTSFSEMAQICETESCGKLKKFIEEYTIILAKTVKNILEKAFGPNFKELVYENQLVNYINNMNYIFIENSIDTENDTYFWFVLLKKINSKFQELSSIYISDDNLISSVDKKYLHQKMILATVIVETNYANTLCVEYNVCIKTHQVSDLVLEILESLTNAPEEKFRIFVRALYRALYDTTFYTQIGDEVGHKLQVFLYDISESKNETAEILLRDIQDIVKEHLKVMKSNKLEKLSSERRFVHAILLDLDIIYVNQSSASFTEFLQHFDDFIKLDKEINSKVQKLFMDIKKVLSDLSGDLFYKLMNEVRVLIDILFNGR